MLGKQSDGEIKLICTEQAIPEFPNLLFGTSPETGTTYFDATNYINQSAPNKPIRNFFGDYRMPIHTLCESYKMKDEDVVKINEQGHYLIDGNFVYLFISFVEPNFLAYVFDLIHELFSEGIVVSDSYLAQTARRRLTKEILISLTEDETEPTDQ